MIINFSDTINFISKLTPKKILNIFKLLVSYYHGRITGRPGIWGRPASISVEPTTSCNLRCPQCPSGLRAFSRNTGAMEFEVYKNIIDQLKGHLSYLLLYFQGEPYLNPSFFRMVNYANQQNIYTATSTNGHYLSQYAKATVESGLSRLIISVDGVTQRSYEKYRVGGKLEKVLEGTRKLIEWKRKLRSSHPQVIFQFLMMKHNEDEINEMKKLASEIGVDRLTFKTTQIYDYEQNKDLIPENAHLSRYKKSVDGKYVIKNRLLNHCWKMWHATVFTWDGNIVPCCFDKDAKYKMGNIQDKKFDEIWLGDQYKKFRKHLFYNRNNIDICKNCTEGSKIYI